MKKYFMKKAPKEETPEQMRDNLEANNIPTYKGSRKTKFSGFTSYAKDVADRNRKDYNTPVVSTADGVRASNPYTSAPAASEASNPYAQANADPYGSNQNPYASAGAAGQSNPYGSSSGGGSNPYGSAGGSNPYGGRAGNSAGGNAGGNAGASAGGSNPYGGQANPYGGQSNPYGSASGAYGGGHNSYETDEPARRTATQSTEAARDQLFGAVKGRSGMGAAGAASSSGAAGRGGAPKSDLDELNELPDADEDELLQMPSELNQQDAPEDPYGQQFEGQEEVNSEDEDVENIKREIRFTKQESAQSTRNALRLAAEAEASGRNTLGMLGSQGERIANTERSMALAESQTKIAEEQSRELQRLNRSIFIPNVSNPFNSKRRMQEKEARIKSEHLQEQIMREKRRQDAYESEQRVMNGLNGNGYSDTALKYKQEMMKNSEGRKKYQFEEDSEDEALENEIDTNLEGLSAASTRLHKLGQSLGTEIDNQNHRLDRITDQTDNLDVNVHLNAARLAGLH